MKQEPNEVQVVSHSAKLIKSQFKGLDKVDSEATKGSISKAGCSTTTHSLLVNLISPSLELDGTTQKCFSAPDEQADKLTGGIANHVDRFPHTLDQSPDVNMSSFHTANEFISLNTSKPEISRRPQLFMQHNSEWDGLGPPSPLTELDNSSEDDDNDASDIKDSTSSSFSEPPRKKCCTEEKERGFINPTYKIKISKEAAGAGFGSCLRRVDALGIKPFHVDLPADVLDFSVSRRFTSDIYGGNLEQTFPKLRADKEALHPYRNFMYLNLDHNPYAPQRAGYPGLFYRAGTNVELKEYRLIIRVKSGVWMYLGQYELVPSTPLTKQEWNANGRKTKISWLGKVLGETSRVDIRARISLRKTLGREPTIKEVEECNGSGVTEEDIQLAYSRGEERVGVWVMKCVGYDEVFQREMQQKSATWVPRLKEPKESKTRNMSKKRRRAPVEVSKPVERKKKLYMRASNAKAD